MTVQNGVVQLQPLMLVAIVIVSGTAGFALPRIVRPKTKKRIYTLDSFVMVLSLCILIISFVLQAFGKLETFAGSAISVFSSVIFSWLLTKASNKGDFELQEQALAKKSYRHINYIESAARTAESTISQYITGSEQGEIDNNTKLILSRALDHIGYISGGIRTCKMDWFDLLSKEDQDSTMQNNDEPKQIVNMDPEYNQEDA